MEKKREEVERHFVLVHGNMHGAWCWYKLSTLLQSVGHKVTPLDMAASGINPKQATQVKTYREYVEPLTEFLEALPSDERVILVGHSSGGGCISVAMEQFPEKVYVAVFVAALMPGPSITFAALAQEDLTLSNSLMRPSPSSFYDDYELFDKQTTFTQDRFGKVTRVYIMADQDMLMKDEFQKWMINLHPPNEVKKIDGSDHFLMFSTPIQLFSCLQEVCHKY